MENKLKELRIKIDGLSQLVKEIEPDIELGAGIIQQIVSHGRFLNNRDKAYYNLILAKEWLGELLQETFERLEEDKEVTDDIQVWTYFNDNYIEKSHKEKLEYLIKEVKEAADLVLQLEGGKLIEAIWTDYMHEIKLFAYKNLCEARFYLQFELKVIKENEKS